MQYENRQPKEGINVSRVNPLSQFLQLTIGALVLVALVVVMLQFSGAWLAKRVPFKFELAIMQELDIGFGSEEDYPDMSAYLNDLAQRVAAHIDMPEDMKITVHYESEDVFNAFATVGGNLMFYKGLLEGMPDENTLAMVMAHEIAHVVHRDPVASLGGGVASTLAILALTGSTGSNMAGSVLGGAGTVTGMQFTRGMETSADELALATINKVYGHVAGATTLFEMFSEARGPTAGSAKVLERFLSTHPRDVDRISAVGELAEDYDWQLEGALTPLPAQFGEWL